MSKTAKRCASCDGPLQGDADHEAGREAMKKEHDENFPGMSLDTAVVVCDACYQRMTEWQDPKAWTEGEP